MAQWVWRFALKTGSQHLYDFPILISEMRPATHCMHRHACWHWIQIFPRMLPRYLVRSLTLTGKMGNVRVDSSMRDWAMNERSDGKSTHRFGAIPACIVRWNYDPGASMDLNRIVKHTKRRYPSEVGWIDDLRCFVPEARLQELYGAHNLERLFAILWHGYSWRVVFAEAHAISGVRSQSFR